MDAADFYVRRLDRSPEKQEFHQLPQEDKHLISGLRSVVGGARGKVSQLRDQLDDKCVDDMA